MENASRALIIASGILIGILILTLAVYLYSVFNTYVINSQNEIEKTTLEKFNQNYMKYHDRKNLTIQDVITARNNALDNNRSYSDYYDENGNPKLVIDEEYNNFIGVTLQPKSSAKKINLLDEANKDLSDEQLLNTYIENSSTFKCIVTINSKTGRVYKIQFMENT